MLIYEGREYLFRHCTASSNRNSGDVYEYITFEDLSTFQLLRLQFVDKR